MNTEVPPRMSKGPARLMSLFNGLSDFVLRSQVLPGEGLAPEETVNGLRLSVSSEILALARQAAEAKVGIDDPDSPFNPGGTGNGGTGLPDTGTDPTTGEPTYRGNPLEWQELYVCVSDGEGGWTPTILRTYGTLSAT